MSDALETWEHTLLPKEVAGYVLRIATLHSKVLETFLIRFFEEASDRFDANSTAGAVFCRETTSEKDRHCGKIVGSHTVSSSSQSTLPKRYLRHLTTAPSSRNYHPLGTRSSTG